MALYANAERPHTSAHSQELLCSPIYDSEFHTHEYNHNIVNSNYLKRYLKASAGQQLIQER